MHKAGVEAWELAASTMLAIASAWTPAGSIDSDLMCWAALGGLLELSFWAASSFPLSLSSLFGFSAEPTLAVAPSLFDAVVLTCGAVAMMLTGGAFGVPPMASMPSNVTMSLSMFSRMMLY